VGVDTGFGEVCSFLLCVVCVFVLVFICLVFVSCGAHMALLVSILRFCHLIILRFNVILMSLPSSNTAAGGDSKEMWGQLYQSSTFLSPFYEAVGMFHCLETVEMSRWSSRLG